MKPSEPPIKKRIDLVARLFTLFIVLADDRGNDRIAELLMRGKIKWNRRPWRR